jgi:L-ascorbate metabolism protein UlaG (beta-lactamase superfamily)
MQLIESGNKINFNNIKIEAIPAYNKNRPFHEKNEGWIGYIIEIGNVVIYHAGDTDLIDEMTKLTGYAKQGNKFIALLPIGGKVTMNIQEAIQAAKKINADIVVPMHYGSITGTKEDGRKFVEFCKEEGINAELT